MKKKAIILIGILIISSIFMISACANYSQTIEQNPCPGGSGQSYANDTKFVFYLSGIKLALIPFIKEDLYFKK